MAQTLTLTCIQPGGGAFLTDEGRPGYRHLGIPAGGAADTRAMNAANRLLGRERSALCLELTQSGGQWLLSGKGQFAITGADMNWRLNGRLVEACQVQYLDGDGLLTATTARRGLRAYLSVKGRWDTPRALGSAEKGLPAVPPVRSGWAVNIVSDEEAAFSMDLDVHRFYPPATPVLTAVPGPEWDWLSPAQKGWLLGNEFIVHPDSNRQGIRFTTDSMPELKFPEMPSGPVLPGTVQLSPAGPILLGPDAQTIGGYPRVLLITEPDTRSLANQVAIGETVRFQLPNNT